MIADRIAAIAFAIHRIFPNEALQLQTASRDVRRMEHQLNEIVASAQDDERDGEAYCAAFNCAKLAGVLVEFPQARRVRRIAIGVAP
jgi:hypothetical protein